MLRSLVGSEMCIRDRSFFDPATLCYLLLGSSLIYAGGCFLNDACDHAFDLKHRPERPIPSGALSLGQTWLIGLAQLGAGAWVMIQLAGCSWPWTVALLLCILAYDWIHKKTVWGIVLMGGCRSLLWITAGTAASGMSPAPLLYVWASTVGLYVVGISWFARNESIQQKNPERDRLLDRLPCLLYTSPSPRDS